MEADRARQNEAIIRYRIAIERGQEHMDEIGRCGRIEDPGARKFEYERLRERGKRDYEVNRKMAELKEKMSSKSNSNSL